MTLTDIVTVLRKNRILAVFLIENSILMVLHTVLENSVPAVMSKQTGVAQVSTMQMLIGTVPI